jgi:bacterial/archaeal transporter family protein
LRPFFTARIKSLPSSRRTASAKAWADSLSKPRPHCRSIYLAFLWLASRWSQQSTTPGIFYSVLTGVCVGAGTIAFFLLFQKGGPLSAVPVILAVGAAIMAIAGILFFREPASWPRLTGIALAIIGLLLLRR